MTFAYPLGLLGLLSLPVILFLHLLRERQRRYIVSNLRLWSFLDNEFRGPRTRRIPITWLLLLDLLIGALLSLGLAQPRLTLPVSLQSARHFVLVLDVSSSMRAEDGVDTRLAQSKAEALQVLDRAGPRDIVTIVSFGRGANWVGDSRQNDFASLVSKVENLQAGETGHELEKALALGEAALDGSLPVEFHVMTDGAYPEPEAASLSTFQYPLRWHFYGGPVSNQAVIELNAVPLDENKFQVFARFANFGDQPVSRSVSLLMDDEVADTTTLEIPANSTVPQIWTMTGNPQAVRVAFDGQDRLRADDQAATSLQPGGQVRVALVADNPSPLQQAIEAVPEANLEVLTPQEYESEDRTGDFELVVFRGYLPGRWPAGQVLLVEPPNDQAGAAEPALFSGNRREISVDTPLQIPTADPILSGVDFGGVRWSRVWTLENIPAGFTPLVQVGEYPVLLQGSLDAGGGNQADTPSNPMTRILVLLADMSRGNFTKHPAFPILMANLVQGIHSSALPASVLSGEAISLPSLAGVESLRVTGPGAETIAATGELPASWDETLEPGLYRFELAGMGGEHVEYIAGVNAGDVVESDVRPRSWIQALAGSVQEAASQQVEDPEARRLDLMPWLLGLAALALLVEAYIAWR